jgi:hypothetical protein
MNNLLLEFQLRFLGCDYCQCKSTLFLLTGLSCYICYGLKVSLVNHEAYNLPSLAKVYFNFSLKFSSPFLAWFSHLHYVLYARVSKFLCPVTLLPVNIINDKWPFFLFRGSSPHLCFSGRFKCRCASLSYVHRSHLPLSLLLLNPLSFQIPAFFFHSATGCVNLSSAGVLQWHISMTLISSLSFRLTAYVSGCQSIWFWWCGTWSFTICRAVELYLALSLVSVPNIQPSAVLPAVHSTVSMVASFALCLTLNYSFVATLWTFYLLLSLPTWLSAAFLQTLNSLRNIHCISSTIPHLSLFPSFPPPSNILDSEIISYAFLNMRTLFLNTYLWSLRIYFQLLWLLLSAFPSPMAFPISLSNILFYFQIPVFALPYASILYF